MAAVAPAPPPVESQTKPRPQPRSSNKLLPLGFGHVPALWAAVLFAAGVLAEHFVWRQPALLLLAIGVCGGMALAASHWARRAALPALAALWFALGFLCAELEPQPDAQTALRLEADGTARSVEGEAVRLGPLRTEQSTYPYSNRVRVEHVRSMDLRVSRVDGVAVAGGVRLTVYAPVDAAYPQLGCGDRMVARVPLHEPERYLDPGVWDSTAYLRGQGIGVLASGKADAVTVTHSGKGGDFWCRLHAAQQRASERMMALGDGGGAQRLPAWLRLSHDDAAMLTAMVTGDRTYLQRHVRVGFERTGSFHLLVVSGLHLAVFAGLIFWLAGLLRLPRWASTLMTIGAALGYALFTGFGQPVQRSFWMVTLYLVCRLLWREKSALNAIGFAALGLLAAHPHALFDAGFEMTLLSVLATGGIAAPIAERSFGPYLRATSRLGLRAIDASLAPRVAEFRVMLRILAEHLRPLTGRWVAWTLLPFTVRAMLRGLELLLVSVSIELVMALPMTAYFHRVTVFALPVNVLVVPLIGVLLPAALATLVAALMWPGAAVVPAGLAAALLHVATGMIHLFAHMHAADVRLPSPGAGTVTAWVALLALAIWSMRWPGRGILVGVAALAAGAMVAVWPHPLRYQPHAVEVTAIDVGQGDSLLVVTPEGRTLLVDGGGVVGGSPDAHFDIGEDVVSAFLWQRGIRRLDAVALTHAHADHIGGLPAVVANFRPRELWVGRNPDAPAYRALLDDAAAVHATVRRFSAGDHFLFGGADVRVLAPEPDYVPEESPTNNDSLVLHVGLGTTSVLLEGDAEAPSEAAMEKHPGLQSEVLKVGHHGSKTSTTPEFLRQVAPGYAVISVGRRNSYGHPRHEVLEELQAAHVRTYRTDMLGATAIVLDGAGVSAHALAAAP